ncbi:MAG TPA: hypothetical protein PLH16_03630, partial [Candidatus Omnitrophota bacterium]|nr:hypothetical protein [Candidatus Omnitrophota bacterium]
MNTSTYKKIIAVLVAVSLAFLQAVPMTFATEPVGTGVPASYMNETPADATGTTAAPTDPVPSGNVQGSSNALSQASDSSQMIYSTGTTYDSDPLAEEPDLRVFVAGLENAGYNIQIETPVSQSGQSEVRAAASVFSAYLLTVTAPDSPSAGGLRTMTLEVTSDADRHLSIAADSVEGTYLGVDGRDLHPMGRLLYPGLQLIAAGTAADDDAMNLLATVKVLRSYPKSILIEMGGIQYSIARDNKWNISYSVVTPPVVQDRFKTLRDQLVRLGLDFTLELVLDDDGQLAGLENLVYKIKANANASADGKLHSLELNIRGDGQIDPSNILVKYGAGEGTGVNGEMFFEGLRGLAQAGRIAEDVQALVSMARVSLLSANDDEIRFINVDGKEWMAYEDQNTGKAIPVVNLPGEVQGVIAFLREHGTVTYEEVAGTMGVYRVVVTENASLPAYLDGLSLEVNSDGSFQRISIPGWWKPGLLFDAIRGLDMNMSGASDLEVLRRIVTSVTDAVHPNGGEVDFGYDGKYWEFWEGNPAPQEREYPWFVKERADISLLLEALTSLRGGMIISWNQAMIELAQVSVSEVDEDGAIYFTKGD